MRIHSDILTAAKIKDALGDAQRKGHVSGSVEVDVLSSHGSRKRKGAVEVQLGSDTSASFISEPVLEYAEGCGLERSTINKIKRRHTRQGKGYRDDLRHSATWHEYGHFIAELFAVDPNAIIGTYDGADSFYHQTYNDGRLRLGFDYHGRMYDFLADIEDWGARTNNYNYWS